MWWWGGWEQRLLETLLSKGQPQEVAGWSPSVRVKYKSRSKVGRIIGVKTLGQKQASLISRRIRTSTAGGGREGSHLQIQARGLGPRDIWNSYPPVANDHLPEKALPTLFQDHKVLGTLPLREVMSQTTSRHSMSSWASRILTHSSSTCSIQTSPNLSTGALSFNTFSSLRRWVGPSHFTDENTEV